ncbi:hypothetical protein K439DRAFT_518304 [Ramaria rubella]|nr:hypothetical protein K439DRAFT_518304 [Ramaria rubella]
MMSRRGDPFCLNRPCMLRPEATAFYCNLHDQIYLFNIGVYLHGNIPRFGQLLNAFEGLFPMIILCIPPLMSYNYISQNIFCVSVFLTLGIWCILCNCAINAPFVGSRSTKVVLVCVWDHVGGWGQVHFTGRREEG